jgi:hypothetical protein
MAYNPYASGDIIGDEMSGEYIMAGDHQQVFGDIVGDIVGDEQAGSYVMGDDMSGFSFGIPPAMQGRIAQGQALLRRYGPSIAAMDPRAAQAMRYAQMVSGAAPSLAPQGAQMASPVGRPAGMPAGVQFHPQFAPRVVQYRPFNPTKPRRVPLGFSSETTVLPGAQPRIISRPQVPMRFERLVIPSDIAGLFVVADLKVGNKSQLPASGDIPGRLFQENAVGIELQGDTAYAAIDVVIEVRNVSGAPAIFRAGLVGMTVQELSAVYRDRP